MEKLKQFFQNIHTLYLIAGACFLLGGILLIISVIYGQDPSYTDEVLMDGDIVVDTETDVVCSFMRFLDGVCVDSILKQDPALVGIMIENHFEARPVSGLTRASVVYEAPVEGNYNRFFALFPEDTDVEKVGPVRSARPYFLDWLSEYPSTMYMHVGGSPDALDKIVSYDLFDLNEFYRGWYYWRDNARYAPHNVYTSQKLWSAALSDYQDMQDPVDSHLTGQWKFRPWDTCTEQCVNEITTTFAGKTYEATWHYNTSTEQYERYEFGDLVTDPQTSEPVVADTLIIQYVHTTVLDGVGRLGMDTIGSGEALVFRNGFKVEGEWRKPSRIERTKFYDFDEEGHPIEFKAGKIWIVVMNQTGGVTSE
ncbi:MAG: hypothetical protein UV82_C0006G0022 [Candidatus Magasanikbacteria bacterium GW2011_GWD2_43_18]|uniref:PT repeat-containing protein n=1 Tax=Candidatus Magasanikbacteria bacterium GW2011_GWE2_42_7 TaxID=1619052 RepID=A0A0G1BGI8_9BACT|nr:MAG: hypothetical protein UV18_C0005G0065 [Candidatus Magasanikbacteria bacterium GW2011_GWC2_42_27]KKS72304.1 MAG: hypothetical protein UV42_C0010G0007 [Candidatus Magasanikbacteria bacterium GW2011_GWE2_42_7]KKT04666.1 MAG: hypothetical protein UV82_C0006G0022 [Candidatus Magasanikbacteria bacterium GW2011_GWD2_43_18]HBB37973.1 hypothetical protein [Candidatus Magasanikbacteria bacterium]HCC13275.1 hypothetical protein [Candidatus Magasanikbacteria bacterium]